MIKINLRHLRELNYCSTGIKMFCKTHGLDMHKLLHGGFDEDELLRTGDHFALRAVEHARKRREER